MVTRSDFVEVGFGVSMLKFTRTPHGCGLHPGFSARFGEKLFFEYAQPSEFRRLKVVVYGW